MSCFFVSEMKNISQQNKVLEHNRGTPDLLLILSTWTTSFQTVFVSNIFCFFVISSSLLYSALAIKNNHILILEPVTLSYMAKQSLYVWLN